MRWGEAEHATAVIIAGLDPAIQSATLERIATKPEWMPGTSAGMTTVLKWEE
jgi:hypothetical protein